jgi:hypothetical protein
MKRFAILQSGFITNLEKGLIKNQYIKDPFVDLALDKDHLKSKSLYFYHKEINDIYEDWRGDKTLMKSMDFRERILKAAKDAFNSYSIYQWFLMQGNTETLTELHQRFIYDTLSFVQGQKRSIEAVQWIRLLEASEKTQGVKIDVDKYFDNVNFKQEANFSSSALSTFLVTWTSQPNGFEDLMITLFVIFGDRPYVTDVADKNVM